MEVGNKLKKMRLNREITIYHVNKVTDIAQNHISSIEAGKITPRIDTLEKIVGALGCTMSEFFNEDADVFYLTEIEKTLVSQYRTLSKEQQRILSELVAIVFHNRYDVHNK